MKSFRIVLVEDNPADVFLVQKALAAASVDHALTQFTSGTEAVRVLCSPEEPHGPVPDAILLDLNTPRTDGFEALRALKETPRLAGVPIAILTSSRARSDKHRASILGTRYIEKPSQLEEFLSTVGQAVKDMLGSSGKM